MPHELPAGYHAAQHNWRASTPGGINPADLNLGASIVPSVPHHSLDAAIAVAGPHALGRGPQIHHAVNHHYQFGMNSKGG